MASEATRKARRAAGLCVHCGDPAPIDPRTRLKMKNCVKCSKRIENRHAEWAQRKKGHEIEAVGGDVYFRGIGNHVGPQQILNSTIIRSEATPEGATRVVLGWVLLRQYLFEQLKGPRRLIARSMLTLMARAESKALGSQEK
jgi:hypothetical protein